MAQEGEAHVGVAPHAVQLLVSVGGHLLDRVGAQDGELARVAIAPHEFDGVEVVAVGGEPFDDEPVTLSSNLLLHHLRSVREKTVPDQGELVVAEVTVQVLQELDERVLVVGAGTHVEHHPRVGTVGCEPHCGGH